MEKFQPRVSYWKNEEIDMGFSVCSNPKVLLVSVSGTPVAIGKGRIIRRPGGHGVNGSANSRGKSREDRVAILSFGTRLHDSLVAANEVEESDPSLGVTVADARFMKPLDVDLIRELVDEHSVLITVEEGAIGGFGDHVLHFLSLDGAFDEGKLKFRPMVLPDELFEAIRHRWT